MTEPHLGDPVARAHAVARPGNPYAETLVLTINEVAGLVSLVASIDLERLDGRTLTLAIRCREAIASSANSEHGLNIRVT